MHLALFVLLALETAAMHQSPSPADQYEVRHYVYSTAGGKTHNIAYRLLTPEWLVPDRKYPLVIFLHGAGERGSDNVRQLRFFPEWMATPAKRAKYPCFILAPQCPADEKWVDTAWDQKHSQPLSKEPAEPMKQVIGMLDQLLKSEPIDDHRIYLTGLSMGGYGCWDLAERMPKRFAAVAPLCGGGDDTKANRLVGIPLWAFHGDHDKAVAVELSREMIAALKKAGGRPKYTEIAGGGHECWNTAYQDSSGLIEWMFEQVKK